MKYRIGLVIGTMMIIASLFFFIGIKYCLLTQTISHNSCGYDVVVMEQKHHYNYRWEE